MNNKSYYILPLVILVILLIAGSIYYSKNKNTSVSTNNKGGNGSVLGVNTADNQPQISEAEYAQNISDIRQPINKKIEELMPKTKYSTLFNTDQLVNDANDIKKMLSDGKNTLSNLNLSTDLKSINTVELESLKNLDEAMDAFIAMEQTSDTKEKQKQSDLVNYKIEESNRLIQNIKFTSSSPSSSGNSTVPLQ